MKHIVFLCHKVTVNTRDTTHKALAKKYNNYYIVHTVFFCHMLAITRKSDHKRSQPIQQHPIVHTRPPAIKTKRQRIHHTDQHENKTTSKSDHKDTRQKRDQDKNKRKLYNA